MNSTDTVTNWRDLADQMTSEQISQFEYCEREQTPNAIPPDALLRAAQLQVQHNQLQRRFQHVPVPADAHDEPSDWDTDDGELFSRSYTITSTEVDCKGDSRVYVEIVGRQLSDGTVARTIWIDGSHSRGVDMNGAQAREVAAALLAAAHRLDSIE